MNYIRHFAKNSEQYKLYRPNYPEELFTYLESLVVDKHLAWDCGTGNGQAAVSLAKRFDVVIASDINVEQLNAAPKVDAIHYHCWPAEKTELEDQSVDLITIAQALHWFKFDSFYQEVKRVAKQGGIVAAWCYSLGNISSTIDPIIRRLYVNILGDKYWPPERKYVEEEYCTIPFPFQRISPPSFVINQNLNFNQLIGYLGTWSAVKEYEKQKEQNPINRILPELQSVWGDPLQPRLMVWPLHLIIGRVI
ncbi:MAG: class I SAM-dependent methyltransferase [Proteobacteria bacterium]|nr:class I SAM-dependent methyltransferase [Pseudomonadota bacterium]